MCNLEEREGKRMMNRVVFVEKKADNICLNYQTRLI